MLKHNRLAALDRLAAAEKQFLASEFLAPVASAAEVHVRIAGIVCKLKVEPAEFRGWGIFRPLDAARARFVRNAKLGERRKYLDLFPKIRVLIISQQADHTLIVSAHAGDRRVQWSDPMSLELAEEVQLFDTVIARFDGTRFWFDELDPNRDPAVAAYLRESQPQMIAPEQLDRSTLTPEERAAYSAHFELRVAEARATAEAARELLRDRTEERLRAALAHAGARLADYREHEHNYQVRFFVDGHEHVSLISKGDLTVQSAGICLSGDDEMFDLESLVGVLRESPF